MKLGLLIPLLAACSLHADIGTLIPSNKQAPDPAVLSLAEAAIDIHIDGANARVLLRQIFASHSNSPLEGAYTFALPGKALLSDFAVWDGPVRIPGVILERRRAEEIYQDIRLQALDPGLLQMGEVDDDSSRQSSVFSARVVPIPARGNKRVELEYHQRLDLENLLWFLAVPLKPSVYRQQSAGRLWITLHIDSASPIESMEIASKSYPLQVHEKTANRIRASLDVRNFAFTEDFAITLKRAPLAAPTLAVTAQRDNPAEPGYFEAALTLPAEPPASQGPPRHVVAVFDASLSMQWDKLERSYAALAKLLTGLRPEDRFHLLTFNTTVSSFSPQPTPGGPNTAQQALDWLKQQPLRGATNLQSALDAALAAATPGSSVVLFTDGGASDGEIRTGRIAAQYESKWRPGPRPRTFVFAAGDDVNQTLLAALARNDGLLTRVRSTEPLDFHLDAFLSKLVRRPVPNLALAADANLKDVYPLQDQTYSGSQAAWVGRYTQPVRTTFRAGAAQLSIDLPAAETNHPQLSRAWAKARVDALLAKIDRDGEDKASIDEIIRLSRKYKFVTPYTSFLAAPRALLRPRLIRPGDPIIRVRTDPAIASVVAIFPFGLVKPLRYLAGEDIWQTRFLAPTDLEDGPHPVRLLLRDRHGNTYNESRSFVILSKPPTVRARTDKQSYRPGEVVTIKAAASQTTRTVSARLYGAPPASLRWDAREKTNVGRLVIPPGLAPGRYTLTVTAEDAAHNIGSQEVPVAILP